MLPCGSHVMSAGRLKRYGSAGGACACTGVGSTPPTASGRRQSEKSLRHWEQRFQANRAKIAELYDERFCRMWEAYLIGCEMGFRHQGLVVFQIQIAKKIDAVPFTRDYIYEWEHKRARDTGSVAAE